VSLSRRVVLGIIIAAIVPAFALTQLVVIRYRDERKALANDWSTRGEQDVARQPAAAITDFETALSYGPERVEDRFRLAQALMAADRPGEARAQLLTLVADEPSRGDLNLALARLAAHGGDLSDAVRYYHAAIDGSWPSGAAQARRKTRIALARLLMANGQLVPAQAELIGLIDDLPRDARVITNVASLLADAGAAARALGLLRQALEIDPANSAAAQLAGSLEFAAGDLRGARHDLLEAAKHAPLSQANAQTLDVVERVFELDPYVDRLASRVRAERALHALEIAKARLERCAAMPMLIDQMDDAMKRTLTQLEHDTI
jgi:tetratricopeptide (TPR) repeat protein